MTGTPKPWRRGSDVLDLGVIDVFVGWTTFAVSRDLFYPAIYIYIYTHYICIYIYGNMAAKIEC